MARRPNAVRALLLSKCLYLVCRHMSELLEQVLSQPQSAQDDKLAHTRAIVSVSGQQTAAHTHTHTEIGYARNPMFC